MSLGREIQDFLGAWTAVDHIATNRSKRDYYANGGRKGSYDPNNPPPGWGGGNYGNQKPGLGRRITNAIGLSEPGGQSVGQKIGGAVGIGGGGVGSYGGPMNSGGGYAPPAYDPDEFTQTYEEGGVVEDPLLIEQQDRRLRGQGDVSARYMPMRLAEDRMPPMSGYAPEGRPAQPPPAGPAIGPAVGASPPAAPAARKALGDQTRTEAYDPELDGPTPALPGEAYGPPASAAPAVGGARPTPAYSPTAGGEGTSPNAAHDLEAAIDGGLKFAQKTFHLDNSNVAVGTDPHRAGGAQALMQGVGAAPAQLVQAMDQRINQGVSGPNAEQLHAIRRLEAIYTWRSANGDKAGADKAAFELMQFSAGVAAKMGQRAVQQYQSGDVPGAQQTVVAAYNQIPDGRHLTVQGNTATVVDTRTGNPVHSFQFTPEQVMNAALGLSNRSLYWQTLAARVAGDAGGSKRTESQQDLDHARADYYRARTGQVGKPKAGGGRAGPDFGPMQGIVEKLNAIPRPGGAPALAPPEAPQDNTPPQGGGDDVGTGDDDEDGRALNAPPDLKEPTAPASVLRLKPPKPGSGSNPPPTSVAEGAGEPAPSPAVAAGAGSRPSGEAVPGQATGPIAAPPEPDPDTIPQREVVREGEKYSVARPPAPPAPAEKPQPFNEEKPAGVPKELLAAQTEAVKLTAKQGGPAVRQHIAQRIKEWQDYNKSYVDRKKAWDTSEAKRVAQEHKDEVKRADQEHKDTIAARKTAAKEAQGYNLNQRDVQAIEDSVKAVYDEASKANPTVAAAMGAPEQVRAVAIDVAQRNKLSAEQALRLTDQLVRAETDKPAVRQYTPHGLDPLGNVVVTMPGAPPLHLSPHIFKSVVGMVKQRLAVEQKTRAEKAKLDAEPSLGRKMLGVGAAAVKSFEENEKAYRALTPAQKANIPQGQPLTPTQRDNLPLRSMEERRRAAQENTRRIQEAR